MELNDPLNGAARIPDRTATAGLVDPLANVQTATSEAETAGYELGNMDACPDCREPMEQLIANDILCNVCIKHRVCLPVKDAQ